MQLVSVMHLPPCHFYPLKEGDSPNTSDFGIEMLEPSFLTIFGQRPPATGTAISQTRSCTIKGRVDPLLLVLAPQTCSSFSRMFDRPLWASSPYKPFPVSFVFPSSNRDLCHPALHSNLQSKRFITDQTLGGEAPVIRCGRGERLLWTYRRTR